MFFKKQVSEQYIVCVEQYLKIIFSQIHLYLYVDMALKAIWEFTEEDVNRGCHCLLGYRRLLLSLFLLSALSEKLMNAHENKKISHPVKNVSTLTDIKVTRSL